MERTQFWLLYDLLQSTFSNRKWTVFYQLAILPAFCPRTCPQGLLLHVNVNVCLLSFLKRILSGNRGSNCSRSLFIRSSSLAVSSSFSLSTHSSVVSPIKARLRSVMSSSRASFLVKAMENSLSIDFIFAVGL